MSPLPVLAGGGLFIAVIQHCIVLYLHLKMVATPTKTSVKASAKVATPERIDDDVVIVGLLKNTQEWIGQGENAKRQAKGFLSCSSTDTFNDQKINIDLPVDNFIASDNGVPLAQELLDLQAKHSEKGQWVKVALKGFWVPSSNPQLMGGYMKAQYKALRVKSYKIIRSSFDKSVTK